MKETEPGADLVFMATRTGETTGLILLLDDDDDGDDSEENALNVILESLAMCRLRRDVLAAEVDSSNFDRSNTVGVGMKVVDVDDVEAEVVSDTKEVLETLTVTELRVSSIEAGRPNISDETCEDEVKMVEACDDKEEDEEDEDWR